jgi:hypothetical protein
VTGVARQNAIGQQERDGSTVIGNDVIRYTIFLVVALILTRQFNNPLNNGLKQIRSRTVLSPPDDARLFFCMRDRRLYAIDPIEKQKARPEHKTQGGLNLL